MQYIGDIASLCRKLRKDIPGLQSGVAVIYLFVWTILNDGVYLT